jgi:hypothetical protein
MRRSSSKRAVRSTPSRRRAELLFAAYAELTRAEIDAIAKDKEVVGVFLYEREGIEDLSGSIAIATALAPTLPPRSAR